ncbi:MAG: hypothetical protein KJO81_08080 [Gammaproteobacteria bacterium]|nr:hypothetical protein [Gammaproteobacteria bacterium]
MASKQSYEITLNNNITEREGLDFVLRQDKYLWNPSKESRKTLLNIFDLDKSFSRAFDLIKVPQLNNGSEKLQILSKNDIKLIELKTTKKHLPNNPKGFFFGATENEFKLAEMLGKQYMFCFVSLHPDTKSLSYMHLEDMDQFIKSKRIQFQINFKK